MNLAAGHAVNQKRIDGTEQKFALMGTLFGSTGIFQDPGDFGGREIGIKFQAGFLANFFTMARQRTSSLRRATILPDNGWCYGLTGMTIPNHGGFTLIGQPNRSDPAWTDTTG